MFVSLIRKLFLRFKEARNNLSDTVKGSGGGGGGGGGGVGVRLTNGAEGIKWSWSVT